MISVVFRGQLRSTLVPYTTLFRSDGALDGTFQVTLEAGSGARTVTRLELRQASASGGVWDTDPATAHWALGAAASLDGVLLNAGTGTVSFAVADGGVFFVFASDVSSSVFTPGTGFSLTVTLADGSVVMVPTTIP